MSTHTCDTIVICCIDFRFQKYLHNWLDTKLKNKTYDRVGFAGSTKDLDTIVKQIDISVRLHHIKQVVIIHHEECGAYGKESTKQKHTEELKKAKKIISNKYPNLSVSLYYLTLNGKFEEISCHCERNEV